LVPFEPIAHRQHTKQGRDGAGDLSDSSSGGGYRIAVTLQGEYGDVCAGEMLSGQSIGEIVQTGPLIDKRFDAWHVQSDVPEARLVGSRKRFKKRDGPTEHR
jgi:hypothetical protein